MSPRLTRRMERIAAIFGVTLLCALVGISWMVDIDRWIGIAESPTSRILELVDLSNLRTISIAFTAAFVSVFVFLPALTSIFKAQEEELQVTVIERQHIVRLGRVSSILFLAALGSLFSVFTLLTLSYSAVAMQAALLVSLLMMTFLRLRRILVLSTSSFESFLDDAVNGLNREMQEIVMDRTLMEARGDEFEEQVNILSKKYNRVPLKMGYGLPSTNRAVIVVGKGMRLKSVDLEGAVVYLNEQLTLLAENLGPGDRYQVKIHNPFRFSLDGPSIPILSVDESRGFDGRIDLQELADGASQLLQKETKFESFKVLEYEQTCRLIVQDFSDCLIKGDVKRIDRNFELFKRIAFPNESKESSHRQSLVDSLTEEVAQTIYLAGDQFMLTNTTRRLVLKSVYSILRESVRREKWYLFERFGSAIRMLLRNEIDDSFSAKAIPIELIQSEIAHLALVLYEQVWVLRRNAALDREIIPFYARQVFGVIRIVFDWCILASENQWERNVRKLMRELMGLVGRYFVGSRSNSLDSDVGSLVLLSLQSYALFRLSDLQPERARDLFRLLFQESPPQDFSQIVTRLDAEGIVSDLKWDQWPLEDVRLGGGYTFSDSKYFASAAFVYWIVNSNKTWIDNLDRRQVEYLIQSYGGDADNLLDEILRDDVSKFSLQLQRDLENRIEEERNVLETTEVGEERILEYVSDLRVLLQAGDFISLVRGLGSTGESAREPVALFSLEMPKTWFVRESNGFPVSNDGLVLRTIERLLFERLLEDCQESLQSAANVRYALERARGAPILLTNFPDIGFDRFSEEANLISETMGNPVRVASFRSRNSEAGMWIVGDEDLILRTFPPALEGWYKIPGEMLAELKFQSDKAKLRIRFAAEFALRPNSHIWKIVELGVNGEC